MTQAVLADWRTAPISPELRAMLGFLERLSQDPGGLGPADLQPLFAAGLDRAAIEEAVQVHLLFQIITRIADGLGFDLPEPAACQHSAQMLLKRGYVL